MSVTAWNAAQMGFLYGLAHGIECDWRKLPETEGGVPFPAGRAESA